MAPVDLAGTERIPNPEPLTFNVVGLAGDSVAVPTLLTSQTVAELKAAVRTLRPSASPRWQRLLIDGRVLEDGESLESFRSPETVMVQFVLAVDPWDLIRGPEIAEEAAQCLDSLGPAIAPHVAQFFEEDDPPAASGADRGAAAMDTLYAMAQRLGWGRRPPLKHLKAALVPHALHMMEAEWLPQHGRQCRISFIFDFIGSVCVPRLVAWLRLQARPLRDDLRWRVEQLKARSEHAAVRLAAKTALSDRLGEDKARIKELVTLRGSLGRDVAATQSPAERRVLQDMLARADEALRDLESRPLDPHTKYALSRALRR